MNKWNWTDTLWAVGSIAGACLAFGAWHQSEDAGWFMFFLISFYIALKKRERITTLN